MKFRGRTLGRAPSVPFISISEVQEPDVQEHKSPLLEVKLQQPIVIKIVRDRGCALDRRYCLFGP